MSASAQGQTESLHLARQACLREARILKQLDRHRGQARLTAQASRRWFGLEIVCVSEVVCEEAFTTPQARVTTAAALRRIILIIGLVPISEAKYPIWFDFG
jgi:hypothetical protein